MMPCGHHWWTEMPDICSVDYPLNVLAPGRQGPRSTRRALFYWVSISNILLTTVSNQYY